VERREGILPHAVLGMFMILVAGAIALSLVTAPAVAPQQLHGGANNTLAASSFVVDDANEVTALAADGHRAAVVNRNTVHVVYQAPDKVLEVETQSSGSRSLVVLGAKGYERTDSGKWDQLQSSPASGPSSGVLAAQTMLLPLQQLSTAVDAVRHGSTYDFFPSNAAGLLTTFGLPASLAQSGDVKYSAVITGENVSAFRIDAVFEGQQVSIDLTYRALGRAPLIQAPPASDVTTAPGTPAG
jgi:hypothetical protein